MRRQNQPSRVVLAATNRRVRTSPGPCGIAVLLLVVSAGLGGVAAEAALFTITTSAGDNGGAADCTLAEAVQAANTNMAVDACPAGDMEPIPDIIDLSGAGGTIMPVSTLNLNSTIEINGPATIDGNNSVRIFQVSGSANVALTLLTLTQGSSGGGGAINVANGGNLAVTGCSFTDNTGSSNGGAINQSAGMLAVTGSMFSGNHSDSDGGAIYHSGSGTAVITATQFSSNSADFQGGALYVGTNTTVTVMDSLFTTNNAADDMAAGVGDGGGAIFVNNGGTLDVSLSVFAANVSMNGRGGAIFVDLSAMPVTIADSSFDANVTVADGDPAGSTPRNGRGGAIYNQESITVDRCTFNGNVAPLSDGGAIANHRQGTAEISNSSFFLNGAGINGGAIHNTDDEFPGGGQSTVRCRNCTFDQNTADLHPMVSGAGGSLHNEETFELWNTIVANGGPQNCSGTITSMLNNLETGTDCGFMGANDLQSTNPQLLPPAFNTAPPATFLLPPFFFTQDIAAMSPALGAGDAATCAAAPVGGIDQVGNSRPMGGGPSCDVGAYESSAVPVELMEFTVD